MTPETGNHSLGHIGQDTVDAALRNIADMHLHVGQTSSLDAVPQGKACVVKPAGFMTRPSNPSSTAW